MRKFVASFFLFFLTAWAAFAGESLPELEVLNDRGEIVFSYPLEAGFAITYVHSVALTPVTDYFIVKNGQITLNKTEYSDFGAGLPTSPEAGQGMSVADGIITLDNLNRALPSFQTRVGRVANHVLLIFKKTGEPLAIPLATLAPPGAALTFTLKP